MNYTNYIKIIALITIILIIYFTILYKKNHKKYKKLSEKKEINNKETLIHIVDNKYVLNKEYAKINKLIKNFNYKVYDLNDIFVFLLENYNDEELKKFYYLNSKEDKIRYCKDKLMEVGENNFFDYNKDLSKKDIPFNSEEWSNFSLKCNKDFYLNKKLKKKETKITLLIRSYKRHEYLKECLKSLKKTDLDFFYQKIILDDNSQDLKLIPIYEEFRFIGFDIKVNLSNEKQNSFVSCLELVSKKSDYVLYLDNDMIVKPHFHSKLLNTYLEIKENLKLTNDKILLTSFDTKKHKIIKRYKNYNEKKTIGGANMFFHYCLINDFKKWWLFREDWGICDGLKNKGGKIFSTKKSYSQHIGAIGDHSSGKNYDFSDNFK
jgi:hypothetical protein